MPLGRMARGLPCLQAGKEGASFGWVAWPGAATAVPGVLAQVLSTLVSRGVPLCARTCCSHGVPWEWEMVCAAGSSFQEVRQGRIGLPGCLCPGRMLPRRGGLLLFLSALLTSVQHPLAEAGPPGAGHSQWMLTCHQK